MVPGTGRHDGARGVDRRPYHPGMRRTRTELPAGRAGGTGLGIGAWIGIGFAGLFALGLAVGGVKLLWRGIDAARAEYAGVAGEVQVTDCRPYDGKGTGWTCSGPFVADDGSFRIERVTIEPYLEERASGDGG
jgi:hypothetical protein